MENCLYLQAKANSFICNAFFSLCGVCVLSALAAVCEELGDVIDNGNASVKKEKRSILKMWTYLAFQLLEAFENDVTRPTVLVAQEKVCLCFCLCCSILYLVKPTLFSKSIYNSIYVPWIISHHPFHLIPLTPHLSHFSPLPTPSTLPLPLLSTPLTSPPLCLTRASAARRKLPRLISMD